MVSVVSKGTTARSSILQKRAIFSLSSGLIGCSVRDALPELAGQGMYELLDSVYESGTPYVATERPVRLDRDGPLAPALRQVAESFHGLWIQHSQSLRLSALEPATVSLGLTQTFTGLVVVAIASNAVEHAVGVTLESGVLTGTARWNSSMPRTRPSAQRSA